MIFLVERKMRKLEKVKMTKTYIILLADLYFSPDVYCGKSEYKMVKKSDLLVSYKRLISFLNKDMDVRITYEDFSIKHPKVVSDLINRYVFKDEEKESDYLRKILLLEIEKDSENKIIESHALDYFRLHQKKHTLSDLIIIYRFHMIHKNKWMDLIEKEIKKGRGEPGENRGEDRGQPIEKK